MAISMLSFWTELTEGQATLLSTGATGIFAIIGVLVTAKLFGDKVKSLDEAVSSARSIITEYQETTDSLLGSISEKIGALDAQIAALLDSAQKQINSREDEAEQFDLEPEVAPPGQEIVQGDERAMRQRLKQLWHQVRNEIDSMASDENIDGRTRAKYFRIPRHSYDAVIQSMIADAEGENVSKLSALKAAADIWKPYQRGRGNLQPNTLIFMEDHIRRAGLVPGQ
jgi:hypothetical protein